MTNLAQGDSINVTVVVKVDAENSFSQTLLSPGLGNIHAITAVYSEGNKRAMAL